MGEAKHTRAEWEAKGLELFGEDKARWTFRCPMCANEMSIARAQAEFPELKGKGWAPEYECIGRYIDTPVARMTHSGERCDWCAYGLFCGPVSVEMDDGKVVHVFDFAGEPFQRDAPPSVQPASERPTAPVPPGAEALAKSDVASGSSPKGASDA